MASKLRTFFTKSNVSWSTYVLVCLFGIGSWVALNGIWVELPIFVQHVPEKWNLPSYLAIICQLANVGPLLFSLGNHYMPRFVNEKPTILVIVSIGSASCLLLAFFWNKTSFVFGGEHSTALLALTFTLSIVDCTSSVVFLTFMSIFPAPYLSALFVGETLSGMLPSFVALGQGIEDSTTCNITTLHNTSMAHYITFVKDSTKDVTVGQGLNYGPESFFLFLFSMMVVCGIAFLALNYMPVARRQHISQTRPDWRRVSSNEEKQLLSENGIVGYGPNGSLSSEGSSSSLPNRHLTGFPRTTQHIICLLCTQAWINCLANGVLPSIQAYACQPYGNQAYHLAVTLTAIASALTCFIALWLPSRSSTVVAMFSVIYTVLSIYMILLASMSPTPILYTTTFGAIIMVAVSVTSGAIISYTKLTICTIMRLHSYRALFWCGISIQAGSCLGALIMFPLVNVAKLFHQAPQTC